MDENFYLSYVNPSGIKKKQQQETTIIVKNVFSHKRPWKPQESLPAVAQ